MSALVVLISLLFIICSCHSSTVKIEGSTHSFVDKYGNKRIYHGVNAVYKLPPYVPMIEGFDVDNSLSIEDAMTLQKYGLNIVRLGVMWPGVEPTKNNYNQTYLDEIESIVDIMNSVGISVILDFHQDLFHRQYCGEGVPDYVMEECKLAAPIGTKAFPEPVVNETYPIDEDGYPEIASCLSKEFATYYLTSEVGNGFQCLYDNKANLWNALGNYWVIIAQRFKDKSNVLGYELINEPYLGNIYRNPKVILPGYTESTYLQPMYEFLHSQIRTVDDDKIIFYEGVVIDYWSSGFTAGPGGADYNDRQAYAYHIYCPLGNTTNIKKQFLCDAVNDEFFLMRKKDVSRIGGGMIMTEFGAAIDTKMNMLALNRMMALTDRHAQSWIYWQLKYFQDITTCTPEGEGLYNTDGTICDDKMKVLSRTYPMVTAAEADTVVDYSFNEVTSHFKMSYALKSSFTSEDDDEKTSTIYFNRDYYYSNGAKVTVSIDNAVEVSCSSSGEASLINIKQLAAATDVIITVEVHACNVLARDCTC